MTASAAPTPPPDHGQLVLRRTVARLIDDGLLTALSVIGALLFLQAVSGHHPSDGYGQFTGHYDGPVLRMLATGFVAAGLFVVYAFVGAQRQGASIGRLAMQLKVVDRTGEPARPSLLFGRELVRVALVGLSLALIQPVTTALIFTIGNVTPDRYTRQLELILGTITGLVPIGLVTAAWVGAALIDASGRAPHDRLARTQVVRR